MLTDKEKQVLELRHRGLKQTDIAIKLDISQSAVSSFENNALRKIQKAVETVNLMKKLRIRLNKSGELDNPKFKDK
ncbi:MAG: sigma factor-like helix-turn-helix DNA-binding protein [Nanoarchaeota archaeon]